jgi:hypothetical protein
MTEAFADHDEVILRENRDVPDAVAADPFQDDVSGATVHFDVICAEQATFELS